MDEVIDLLSLGTIEDILITEKGSNNCTHNGKYNFTGNYLPSEFSRPTSGSNDFELIYSDCDNGIISGLSSINGYINGQESWEGLSGFNPDSFQDSYQSDVTITLALTTTLSRRVKINSYTSSKNTSDEYHLNFDASFNDSFNSFSVKTLETIIIPDNIGNPNSGKLEITGLNNQKMIVNFDALGATSSGVAADFYDWDSFYYSFYDLF